MPTLALRVPDRCLSLRAQVADLESKLSTVEAQLVQSCNDLATSQGGMQHLEGRIKFLHEQKAMEEQLRVSAEAQLHGARDDLLVLESAAFQVQINQGRYIARLQVCCADLPYFWWSKAHNSAIWDSWSAGLQHAGSSDLKIL